MSIGRRFLFFAAALAWPFAALSAELSIEAQSRALERAGAAMLGVETQAIDGARSARTLGKERSGSGVLIGNGLVLTIGYLILEAEEVDLVTADLRRIPARVTAYDQATGFGLVQALAPIGAAPVPLGRSAEVGREEPLLVMSGGEDGVASPARLVARRPFSGYWEYHVDGALFTSPPRRDHSGAGLFNLAGELLGVGSLYVTDALGADQPRMPGNMFVPVDLLKPVLAELQARGTTHASERAWIGISCVEADGSVKVVRVSDDSPADVAGLQAGDQILRIDGTEVARLETLWKRLWSGGGPEREVTLEIQRDGERQTLKVFSVDRAKTLRHAQGV